MLRLLPSLCKIRWEVLMCYTATTPMEKKMKIFRGEAIGCLNRECDELVYILLACCCL